MFCPTKVVEEEGGASNFQFLLDFLATFMGWWPTKREMSVLLACWVSFSCFPGGLSRAYVRLPSSWWRANCLSVPTTTRRWRRRPGLYDALSVGVRFIKPPAFRLGLMRRQKFKESSSDMCGAGPGRIRARGKLAIFRSISVEGSWLNFPAPGPISRTWRTEAVDEASDLGLLHNIPCMVCQLQDTEEKTDPEAAAGDEESEEEDPEDDAEVNEDDVAATGHGQPQEENLEEEEEEDDDDEDEASEEPKQAKPCQTVVREDQAET